MITKKLYQPFLVLLLCCIATAAHTCRATGLAVDRSLLEKSSIDQMINNVPVDINNAVANARIMLDIYTNKIANNNVVLTDEQQQDLVVALYNKAKPFMINWHKTNQQELGNAYKALATYNTNEYYNVVLRAIGYKLWLEKIRDDNKKNMHQYFAEKILEDPELQIGSILLSNSRSDHVMFNYTKKVLSICQKVKTTEIEQEIAALKNPKITVQQMRSMYQKIKNNSLLLSYNNSHSLKDLTSKFQEVTIQFIIDWHEEKQRELGDSYKALAAYSTNEYYNAVLPVTDYVMWLEKINNDNKQHMYEYLGDVIIHDPEFSMETIGLKEEQRKKVSEYWSTIIPLCRQHVKTTIDELVNKRLENASDTANKLIGMRKTIEKNEKLFNKVPKEEPEKSFSDYLKEKAVAFIIMFHKQRALKIGCKALEAYDDKYHSTVLQVTDYGFWLNKIKDGNHEHMYQYAAKSILNDPFFELSGTDKLDKDNAQFIAHIVHIGLVQEEQQKDALGGLFGKKIDGYFTKNNRMLSPQDKKEFFAKQKEKIQKYKTGISHKYPWLIRVQQWVPTLCLPISLSYGNYDWRYDFAKTLVDALIIPQEQLEAYAAKDVNTYTKNVYAKEQYLILKERYPNKSAQDLKEEEKKPTLTFQYYLFVFFFVGFCLDLAYEVEELWLEYLEHCKEVRERKQNHH